jgi:hypothetical protein
MTEDSLTRVLLSDQTSVFPQAKCGLRGYRDLVGVLSTRDELSQESAVLQLRLGGRRHTHIIGSRMKSTFRTSLRSCSGGYSLDSTALTMFRYSNSLVTDDWLARVRGFTGSEVNLGLSKVGGMFRSHDEATSSAMISSIILFNNTGREATI